MKFLLLLLLSFPAMAQTLTLNDSSVIVAAPLKTGINIGTEDGYDNGQILKNLIGNQNASFEPLLSGQIWVQPAGTGSTSSFTLPDVFAVLAGANIMSGASYNVVESTTAAKGCAGSVTANTVGNGSSVAPVITLGTPCATALSEGDQIVFKQLMLPTATSILQAGNGDNGARTTVSGGATITADTSTPYVGVQSLILNTTTGTASAGFFFDDNNLNNWVLLNGSFTFSFAYKKVSGSPTYSTAIQRLGGGANAFNCTHSDTPTSASWVRISISCTGTEDATTPVGTVQLQISQTGAGVTEVDDFQFAQTSSQDPTNTSVFRDNIVAAIKATCGGTTGPVCPIRNWTHQNAETLDNSILPANQAAQVLAGPLTALTGGNTPQLQDYLALVKLVNGVPYLEIPVTFTPTDAANLIEFLESTNTASGYGQKRAALGQTLPWVGPTGVFPLMYLTFCNECWNGQTFPGESLPYRGGAQTDIYQDYAQRAGTIYAAMRADAAFVSSATVLGFDMQLGQTDHLSDEWTLMKGRNAAPDFGEQAPYTQSNVSNWQTDAALWGSAMEEPWGNVSDPASASGYHQATALVKGLNLCGQTGTAACKMNTYEYGNSTLSTCGFGGNPACGAAGSSNVAIDQTHMNYINAGGGRGIIDPLQSLLMIQTGSAFVNNFFGLTEYANGSLTPSTALLWGNFVDAGGSLSALDGASFRARPQLLGLEIANTATIGAMTTCTLSGGATYNWAGDSVNGPTHALTNVPYVYPFCFKDSAGNRSIVLVNTNLTTSYTITLAGTTLPTGTVNVAQFTPPTIDSMNETIYGTNTNAAPLTMSNTATTLSAPTTLTVPAKSITSYKYAVSAPPLVGNSITGAKLSGSSRIQ